MHHPHAARLRSIALVCVAAMSATLCRAAPLDIDLPAQPLPDAIKALARAAGVTIAADSALLAGRTAPALKGRWEPADALARLLGDSGLTVQAEGPGTLVVRRAPAGASAPTLATVTVTAGAESGNATGPVGGLAARSSATATKTATALVEVPQTLTVVPREQIELQGASTVTRALEYAPGVLPSWGGTNSHYDVVQSRGFVPRDHLDGLRLPFSAYSVAIPQFDPYMLERIELLQGPASVLFGQSSPGGVLNMVSRRPQARPSHEVQVQGGNFGRRELAFDTTGPLDGEGTLLYRLTGLARQNDGLAEHSRERRRLIAPSLTWRPSAATSLTLLAHYQHDDWVPQYQGLPAAGTLKPNPNGTIARNRFSGDPSWDHVGREQHGVGYALEHRVSDRLQLRQNFRHTGVTVDSRAMPGYLLGADQRTYSRVATASRAEGSILALDNQAEMRFEALGLHHTVLAGVDLMRQRDDYVFASQLAGSIDLYAPVYGGAVPSLVSRLSTLQKMTQAGLYLQDQIRTGRWVFTLGGRHDRAEADTTGRMPGGSTVSRSDSAFTGRLGANYLFDSGWAPYASLSTSFEPVLGVDFSGKPFVPTKGRQAEAGIRYQPEGGHTLLALAAWRLVQRNVLTSDTAPGHAGFSVQTGEVEVRGLSAEARARPLRGLDLIASYAYTDSEVTRANPDAAGNSLLGKPLSRTPRHTAALWLSHSSTEGPLDGLTVGAGVRYVGGNFTDTAISLRLPAYTLVDAAIHYDFGRARPQLAGWKASLTVSNLADRQYVSYCLSTIQCFWGQPRTVQATLRKQW